MLESFAHIATILSAGSIIFALLAWQGTRNSFHHAVITSCTTRFQKLAPQLSQVPRADKTVQRYLELCNEEVFYFENNYLPQAIIDEWLDGMLSFICLRREKDSSLFYLPQDSPPFDLSPPLSNDQHQLLKNYPRLYHAFYLNSQAEQHILRLHQSSPDAARAQLVLTVLSNLESYKHQPFLEHLRRARSRSLVKKLA